jgi:3D (Asp-Asp-Asp) domain-containing protein
LKNRIEDMYAALRTTLSTRAALEGGVFCLLAAMTATSAALVKESHSMLALASVSQLTSDSAPVVITPVVYEAPEPVAAKPTVVEPTPAEAARAEQLIEKAAAHTRWFNGRPIRPARVLWMQVTAYSPDARSCGQFADGKTATMHSVETNGGHLVAADTRMLPFGSLLSIEGYADGDVVPVLDRGGAIKGYHIDLLMPKHKQAMRWGDKRMPVIVWEYADGKPLDDPRKFR